MTSLSSFSIPIFNRGYYTQQKLPWIVPRAIKNGTQWSYPYPWPSLLLHIKKESNLLQGRRPKARQVSEAYYC